MGKSAKLRLQPTANTNGWRFVLFRKGGWTFGKESQVTLADWPDCAHLHAGASRLLALMDADEAVSEEDGITLSHTQVAALSCAEAAALELPRIAPFTLFISREAPLGDPAFRLRVEWFERNNGTVFVSRREGTRLQEGRRDWLVIDPLFSFLESIDALNALQGDNSPAALDRRMVSYAAFSERLARMTGDAGADEYLQGLTIHHATALGIDLEPGEGQPFTPTLYGDHSVDAATRENEEVEPQREPLLPGEYAGRFGKRFTQQGGRRHYTLGDGVYVVLDAPVTAALEVVERINRADAKTREAFHADPLSFLVPAIEGVGGDSGILCDLRGYGERVIGVGRWEQAKLSFRLPVAREWWPKEETEVFTISLGDTPPLVVRNSEVEALQQAVAKAGAEGAETFQFAGRSVLFSSELETTVRGLTGYVQPATPETILPRPVPTPSEKTAAITKNNEETLTFEKSKCSRPDIFQDDLPDGLRSAPKEHQRVGIRWLQTAYLAGTPGLLLADDMGLGKTFQVLGRVDI